MKKYSVKFWVLFWMISGVFLVGWYFYWNTRNSSNQSSLEKIVNLIPVSNEQKDEWKAIAYLGNYFLENSGQEKTFMVLFQNNLEIRPGGGFIGSFGILKIKDGKVSEFTIHDTGNFDGRIPDTVQPPYPMKETLGIKSWKLRDSNYSPDFAINAKKAEEFYYLGNGGEKFDGIIGITANVLTSLLKATGPIELPGYPGTYQDENAITALEYQVEKGFIEQGIDRGERKSIMNELGEAIIKKVFELDNAQKIELTKIILEDLRRKDIQLYFKDSDLEQRITDADWGGLVDQNWNRDYLLTVDANLGAFKSDYFVDRSIDYSIDLSGEVPRAVLKITYEHNAKEKDWMTKDYLTYLRVYVPNGAWLTDSKNFEMPRFESNLGKKVFASIIKVPLGQTKTVEIDYNLPKELKDNYNLKIQKQAGLNDIPVKIHLTDKDGTVKDYDLTMNSDLILNK